MSKQPITKEFIAEKFGEEFANYLEAKNKMHLGIKYATNYFGQLQSIKKYYQSLEDDIIGSFHRNKSGWHSSYPFDWSQIFTPIEYQAWCSIRSKGKIVLYPQYPVLNYWLDFANPGNKIGVELDGKNYHNEEKDRVRDAKLQELGWTIYRIKGSEMMKSDFLTPSEMQDDWYSHEDDDTTINQLRYWLMETGDGVIEAIKREHFHSVNIHLVNKNITQWFPIYCHQSLSKHQY
jgi:hypothetical protein